MLSPISSRVKLLQVKRREIRAKIHRTLSVALIAPLFVTISAPPSLGLPNTPSFTPTSPSAPSSPAQEVPSPFTSSANLKSSTPITQGANLNSTGLLVRLDAKTTASYSGTGTTWNDISGNGRSAAFTNKSSPLTSDYTDSGFTFKGMGFNGTNQFATINSNFSGAFSGLSISFYANLGAASNYERIIDIGDGAGNKNIIIARIGTTRDLALGIYNGSTSAGLCQANSGIDNNTWAHWTFIADGTNCQIYKNGTAFNSITNTNTSVTSTSGSVAYTGLPENTTRANAYIGKSNWAGDVLFEGQIADLAIFNRALTATEVVEWKDDQISNVNAGSGICANRVANPAAVTVTSNGGDCILKFTALSNATTSNSWVVPAAINRAKVLTVAGGGGGGAWVGGGGGAGGFIEGFTSVSATTAISVSVGKGGTGSSKVGAGGTVAALSGDNSTFGSSFTSLGGGRGASWDVAAAVGGSGGGGSSEGSVNHAGAAATRPEQGFAGGSKSTVSSCNWDYGYPTGGGGGAGATGGSATCVTNSTGSSGAGGNGRSSNITGTTTVYAGGGGGGIHGNATYQGFAGAGGSGGGGAGAAYNNGVARTCNASSIVNVRGGDGTAGLGGGGGGSGAPSGAGCNSTGGTGGSGVVIVRYGTTIQVPVKFASTLSAADPSTLTPYMRFKATDYDATNKIWYDSSGNGRNTSSIRGTPEVVTTTIGNGSTKTFTTVQGGTLAGVQFKNKTMSTNGWTMFSVARYNGAQSGYSRVFDGETDNFVFGFYWGRSGVAHYNDFGWLPTNGVVTPDSYGQNWVVSTGFTDTYRGNGYAGTATNPSVRISRNVGDAFPAMTINAGQQVGSEQSTWQVAETIIFDRKLDVSEIEKVEDYLATTYGIQNYVNQTTIADTVTVNASSGSVTLSNTYTANFGYQNTFSVSPTIPGITLESPATNQARLRIANTVAPGTYWETITATDVMGNTAILPIRVEVVPALQWSVSNPSTFTSTFGKYTRLKLDLSGGFGTRTSAVAHMSSPAPRGVTIDSTSIASGFVHLVVDTGTAAGTYTESITVTDGSGLIRTAILTLTVNSPPDITYSAQTDTPYPYVTQNLLLNLDAANPNSYPGSGSTWTDTKGGKTFTLFGSPTFSQSNGGSLVFADGKQAVADTNWTNLETFTVETWFKLKTLSTSLPCFVTTTYANTHINFAICEWGTAGTIGAGFHRSDAPAGQGWQGFVYKANALTTNTWYHAVYTVSQSGSTWTGTLYLNGVSLGSTISAWRPATQTGPLRIGRLWNSAVHTDGEIPVVRIYNAPLTAQQVLQNYQNSKVRFVSATSVSPMSSGTTSLTATAGKARDFQLFTANDGVGTKTFSLSGVNSAFRVETSTANTAIFKVLASTTSTSASAAKTYYETLTAVDTNGIATAYYLTVTVNPSILITSTSDTITTTFGRTGSTTLNVAVNTGTGSSTFSRVSSSGSSAITATLSSGQAILNVAGTLPAGTYYETLTATDSLGATAFKVITIVVNAAMAIVPATGSTTFETTFTRATTARLNITGGTGNRTYAITYPSSTSRWRITLDTSTAASNFVTVKVDSFTATGTHSISISVTDSLSATASTTLTLVVNDYPILNNVKNENSYIKPGLVLNMDAANSLSSTGAGNWKDLSGAGKSATFTNAPTYSSANGGIFNFNGSSNYLTIPSITTATSPGVTNGAFPEYTAETWVKFTSPTFTSFSATTCLICEAYEGTTGSMNMALSLRNNGQIHSGYLPTTAINWVETVTAVGTVTTGIWYHIAATVVKSGLNYVNTIYLNGVAITSRSSTHAPATSSRDYYIGRRWDGPTQLLNGSIGVVRVYNRGLSQSEIQDNYNALASRYINTALRSSTFTTTQGASYAASSIPATLGTGNKTLTLTPVISGITGDTSTANGIRVTAASTLSATDTQTARTYVETITATDIAGASVTHLVNVTVNPPIILAAGSTSIATTSGIETSTVITASKGSSTVTFTRTGTSTSGITLSAVGNQSTLRVLSTINPGTYYETVTATDTSTAATSIMFTIVVAPPPSMLGSSRLETSKGALFKSPIYAISGGTGTLTMTVTNSPANSNISLTGVTSAGGYLQVAAASETGTYTSTIRVTDAKGAYSEIAVTVIVNAPVTLSGSLSITKTYGNSSTNGYSTNGTGTAPFSFSSTPVCAVVKTVSGSYTYEKINGTDSCTWTAPVGVTAVDALLVGAGGGGGGDGGSGGGGGSINELSSVTLPANRQLTVQIGAGGTGGVWGGDGATSGGTTSLTSGSTAYTAPGGAGGGGCGSAASAGGVIGSGGSGLVGGAGGYGGTGNGCGAGTGGVGSAGPAHSFTGSSVTYGGGGGGGPLPDTTASAGGKVGGSGGGGTGTTAKGNPGIGLSQYFRTFASYPDNANTKPSFISGTCAVLTGNINYSTDSEFPCAQKESFQGYAEGFFVAPVNGSITFRLNSDDSSHMAITVGSTTHEFSADNNSNSATYSGFTQDQWYPIRVFFTERGGLARWQLEYNIGQGLVAIPSTQLRPAMEGLAQYFRYNSSSDLASSKPVFTTGTCGERIGNINYANDAAFPCTTKENFQGYATGYFIAPYTGAIKFYLNSDDSSYLSINVNGTNREFGTNIGDVNDTFSGFVKGQYYPISVFFKEIGVLAYWKLDYEYPGQSRTAIPDTYLRPAAEFTSPTAGTNGLGGGGGAGSAGLYKINGARGGSGTAIIKYLTQSDTATASMITAVVETSTPSGLLTLNVPEYVTVGTYSQTIKVQDAANSAPYSATVTITVNKATPTATLSLPGDVTTATYGTPVTLSARASTPGNVVFKKSGSALTGCSSVATSSGVASCTWTPSVVETASITAVLTPTDLTNYNNSVEAASALSIVVGKADTLTVTARDLTATYSEDGSGNANTTIPTRTVTFDGLAAIDSITAASYEFSGTLNSGSSYTPSATSPKQAGTYSITPSAAVFTSPATAANYKSVVYTPGTLTINRKARGVWDFEYYESNPPGANKIYYGESKTVTVGTIFYAGDATESFTTTSPTCSVNSTTGAITTLNIGDCVVEAVLSQTANWLSDTKIKTVEILKGKRTATLTPGKATIKYGETTTAIASISPVQDSATITFSASNIIPGSSPSSPIPLGCSVDAVSGQITGTKANGSCYAVVEYSETDFYSSAIGYEEIEIRRASAPVVTTETLTALSYTGSTAIVSPTYSVTGIAARDVAVILPTADLENISAIPASDYSSISSYRYVALSPHSYDSSTAPSEGGTYSVTGQGFALLSGIDMSNYESPTYVSSNLVINPILQAALRILLSAQESITVPYDITFAGGSSTGSISAVVVSGGSATGCSVSGLRLSTSSPGTCILQATKAADRNYLEVISETATVTILNFVSYIDWNAFFNNGSGFTITSEVPIIVGAESCSVDCVPEITDVQDASGNPTTTLTVGAPLRLIGVDLNTTDRILFTARINGVRLSSVPADSFQIDSPTQITVMPPANFVPNTGENSSSISVRIIVFSSGGSINTEKIVIISL